MAEAMTEADSSTETRRLQQEVGTVNGIHLTGAPRTLLLDAGALFSPAGHAPPSLSAKLEVLARQEGMRVALLSDHAGSGHAELSGIPGLSRLSSIQDLHPDGPTLAMLGEQRPLPPHVYAWYVGEGNAPPPLHPTRHSGPQATDEILALFGTALVQERAGLAFRAAGAGEEIPREAPFDSKILDGIATAVAPHRGRVEQLERLEHNRDAIDLDRDTERIIAAALPSVLASQDRNGAVAAAPPPHGPDEPNYWFFWQRDAGQVVIALSYLARHGTDPHARAQARAFIARYLAFVEQLPHRNGIGTADLGVSRFEMSGKPIESYGSPQKDGPAHTVLAVLAALGESARAYQVSKPYLKYLSRHILGSSFDPWEFAVGEIFFDYNLARRALRAGARLARAQGDSTATDQYGGIAGELEQELAGFRHAAGGYMAAGRNFLQPFLGTISGLDIDVVGSVLTSWDMEDPFLNVEDPLIQGAMEAMERFCAERWPVNVAWQETGRAGMGMGRFPEDTNDGIGSTGGNPWTFATLWAAQYYLRLAQHCDLLGTRAPGGKSREELLETADGYLRFVLSHVPRDALTEQIDGQEGTPRGARKLAWAQASLIQTLLLRREVRMSSHR